MSLNTRINFGDDRGQLLTLDILVSLIPIVLVLGISANAMTGVMTQMQEYSHFYDEQRTIQDYADALVKAPGIPVEWHKNLSTGSFIGYAKYDSDTKKTLPNYLDMWKFDFANTTLLEDFLQTDTFNITLTLANATAFNLTPYNISFTRGYSIPNNASNIRVTERLLMVDNILRVKASNEFELAINNTERGGGSTQVCRESTFTLDQFEIDSNNYWIFLNYTNTGQGIAPTFAFSVNEDYPSVGTCPRQKPKCNTLLETNDFPDPPKLGAEVIPGFNYENKTSCAWTGVGDQNITYYIQNYTDGYIIYMIIPKDWLIVGTQTFYLWLNGFTSVTTGWYASAPETITRDVLEEYLGSSVPLDDVPSKLTLTMWDS